MSRSIKKGPYINVSLEKKILAMNESGKKSVVKTWARASMISPDFVGHTVAVHNGNKFIPVTAFECVTLEVYDYADFLGRRYWILERYQPKMNCDSEWSYSVQLSGVEGLTTQVLMVNPDDDDNPILTLTAPAREHAALIIANMPIRNS